MEIAQSQPANLDPNRSEPKERAERVRPMATLFIVLFAQLILLILVSFVVQSGPVFVTRMKFGEDFRDFYQAAADLRQHIPPSHGDKLTKPPASILIGAAMQWTSEDRASLIMLVANVSLVLVSLRSLARQYKLTPSNALFLYGIALVFYPFFFLVERGNVDGIVLALLTACFVARKPILRAALLGASIAIKVYSGLFLVVLLAKRRYKTVLVALCVALLLQLPFLHLLPSFLHTVLGRSGMWRDDENISPSVLICLLVGNIRRGCLVFCALWAGSLIYRLAVDDSERESAAGWPEFLPWAISFPALVYPYSGVIALPLLAKIAADCQYRPANDAEKLIFLGIGLLGFQAVAWSDSLMSLMSASTPSGFAFQLAWAVHYICPIGTLFLIAGACALPRARAKVAESAI